ncbi:metallophosphoesterase [Paenibacillus lutrae]|uniref:Metallophosphoesterase n=1 Tax=Paenibacillus lutrae TaxID=2078573 RepID=A0A7X3FL82_9BACL|nr:metallophosphoesterase [Paenibacillus lutrae]MVP01766.1 metallophosphoesterase [Paenibacillus lutrae]
MDPNLKMTRRAFLGKGKIVVGAFLAAPFASYGYARFAEPKWIRTTHVPLRMSRLPKAFDGMRIVHFSDVHIGPYLSPDELPQLMERIQSLNPDLICFTGDLYDYRVYDKARVTAALASLKAPLGKFAVLGNHDYYESPRETEKVFQSAGFELLTNRSVPVVQGKSQIRVAGVDDMWEGRPELDRALQGTTGQEFVLLLSHAPDFADIALERPVDLQLSGHSHGGQVRLPFYGALTTPMHGKKYVDGLYKLGGGKLHVYTNRGIGMTLHPVRFWCRPELTVLTLSSGS